MTTLLVLASIFATLAGLGLLSQATMGVGIICAGAVLAILARINQAADHRNSDRKATKAQEKPPDPSQENLM